MKPDDERLWQAVIARDPRFDGRFYTAVRTTGIYCRPICRARLPRRDHVAFFACAAAAEQAGFRPCLRCRPDTAPGSAVWRGAPARVGRALRLIEEGALESAGVDALAGRVGLGARQLRRLFVEHLGAPPLAVAGTRRLHFARRLLLETRLPIAQVALAAGYQSQRRLDEAFRAVFGGSPGTLRKGRGAPREPVVRLRLLARAPFDFAHALGFLRGRAIGGVEQVDATGYRRGWRERGREGLVEIRPLGAPRAAGIELRVSAGLSPLLLDLAARGRALFDLDADPRVIRQALGRDPRLAGLLRARPGLRVPGAWDPFETAVRAILGQQVSVPAASTLAGRVAASFGDPAGEPLRAAGIRHHFPSPARLADAALEPLGLTRARAQAVRVLAAAVAAGEPVLARGASLEETLARLEALPGFGPWTAAYVAMRALREPDAFPAGDLVLRRALDGAEGEDWRPWRAYAAMHLWAEAAERASRPARSDRKESKS